MILLRGDATWPFVAKFTGSIEVNDVVATWFGGDADPQDNGETACGYPTRGHPELLGCSLPMDRVAKQTNGSPLPRLPWGLRSDGSRNPGGTFVTVWPVDAPERALVGLPLIDVGPGKQATRDARNPHAIDLTIAAFKALGGSVRAGVLRVSFKIVSL